MSLHHTVAQRLILQIKWSGLLHFIDIPMLAITDHQELMEYEDNMKIDHLRREWDAELLGINLDEGDKRYSWTWRSWDYQYKGKQRRVAFLYIGGLICAMSVSVTTCSQLCSLTYLNIRAKTLLSFILIVLSVPCPYALRHVHSYVHWHIWTYALKKRDLWIEPWAIRVKANTVFVSNVICHTLL